MVVALLVGLTWLHGSVGEAALTAAVLAVVGIGVVVAVVLPGRFMSAGTIALAELRIPEHITALVLPRIMEAARPTCSRSWRGCGWVHWALEIASAFPGPVLWLRHRTAPAATALARLGVRHHHQRRLDDVRAGHRDQRPAPAADVPGIHRNLLPRSTASPTFIACYQPPVVAFPGFHHRPARVVALTGVAVCTRTAIVPGQASLWGDWSFELMFHFQNV